MYLARLSVLAVLVAASGGRVAAAQGPPGPRQQQLQEDRLRSEIERRFALRIRQELGLTEDQNARVREIMASYAGRRRTLEQDEQRMREALAGQLRPGIAADADSVTRLVDALSALRVAHAQAIQQEMRELAAVLTPVQRGQLFLMRDRLLQQAAELRVQARLRGGVRPR
jgi:Spy/CpxP family protein refolding chaperone